jgi:nucleoside-diphosphate-sugar epimerase
MNTKDGILFMGSTGLIGQLALPLLLAHTRKSKQMIFAPTRRQLKTTHKRLNQIVGPFDDSGSDSRIESALREQHASLSVFLCALGTTMAQAGSQAAFAAVDHDLVLHMAALAHRHGAEHVVVVSSVGADAGSSNFYLRTKGRMERDLSGLGFSRCDFLHPGLLLGARAEEKRFSEGLAQKLSVLYNPLLLGPLRRYRAIAAETVAGALVKLVDANEAGVYRHEFDELNTL